MSLKLLNSAYGIEECLPKLFDVRAEPSVVKAIKALDNAYEKLKLNSTTEATKATKTR